MNKRGWLRMLEATIAILIVSGVLITVYSKQVSRPSIDDYIYSMQRKILMDISSRPELRNYVMESNKTVTKEELNDFVNSSIPSYYGFYVRVCEIEEVCNLPDEDSIENFRMNSDVFVEDAVISAVISEEGSEYSPKKVRLFIWGLRQ